MDVHVHACTISKVLSMNVFIPYHFLYIISLLIYMYIGTFLISRATFNTGIVHWLQQFCAMFLKRMYHSLQFLVSIIWQLVIPMGFILWGLILGVTIPGLNTDDENRLLSIPNSVLIENNITFFWADFNHHHLLI